MYLSLFRYRSEPRPPLIEPAGSAARPIGTAEPSGHAERRHIRAELPESMHAWIPLLALVPIALLRWLWLIELRRYYRSSDLA